MKKIALSLAGVLAAATFAPEASAIPAFARQTGMACFACHAQHFPVLNGFGRAFKAAGYTMIGAQGKVEGDHLSIPDTLNASFLLKIRYQKDNTTGAAGGGTTAATNLGNGRWEFGDETSLFFGGRVAENIGFLFEGNVLGSGPNAANGNGLLASFKIPFAFDMGTAKLSVIPFATDAASVQFGYELSSGGVLRSNRWAEQRNSISAVQYNADRGADAGAATGIAFVAQNDFGFINLSKWSPSFMPGGNGQAISSTKLSNNYVRVAATPTVANWAMLFGAGSMSGSSYSNVALAEVESRQTFFDFQAQGEVGGKELGVYAQHAKAPAGQGKANAYNTAANICAVGAVCNPDRKATTIGADYSVVPHVLSIGASYRNAKNGGLATVNGDNAVTLTAVYDLYQNVALHMNHSQYSGSSRNAAGAQKRLTTFMLEAAW
ncbi:MAG: hypothetical protein EPN14_05375 [Gallionella sp.]|nr:MAG: hypothetical protein EPN14_05375 [Gallionella sp.]